MLRPPSVSKRRSSFASTSSRSDDELSEINAAVRSTESARPPANSVGGVPRRLRPPPIRTRTSFEPQADSPDAVAQLLPRAPTPAGAGAGRRPLSGGGESSASKRTRQERRGAAEMSLVAPALWVGSETAARSHGNLLAHGITHVVNCTTMPNAHEGRPGAPRYLKLGLLDSVVDLPRMAGCLAEAADFLRAAHADGGTALVHCHRGISRSCAVAMAYMIASQKRSSTVETAVSAGQSARGAGLRSADEVFEDVKRARRVCDPNLGYWVALKEWEQQMLGADAPVEAGDAAAAPALGHEHSTRSEASATGADLPADAELSVAVRKRGRARSSSSDCSASLSSAGPPSLAKAPRG